MRNVKFIEYKFFYILRGFVDEKILKELVVMVKVLEKIIRVIYKVLCNYMIMVVVN